MKLDYGRSPRDMVFALLPWWSLVAAFVLPPLSYLGYPPHSFEYVAALALAFPIAAVLAAAGRLPFFGRWLIPLLVLLYFFVFYYARIARIGALALAFAALLLAAFFALHYYDKKVAQRVIMAAFLSSILLAAILTPPHVLIETHENIARSDRPAVIHILLDEHTGLATIPDTPRYLENKKELEQRYLSAGFTIFPRAYSSVNETRASMSRLFNPESEMSSVVGPDATIDKAKMLETIAATRAIDVTQFDYVMFGPAVRKEFGSSDFEVLNSRRSYDGIARFDIPYSDRIKISAVAFWWAYIGPKLPAVARLVDKLPFGHDLILRMDLTRASYTFVTRGALLDFVDKVVCCGKRGTYYFLHTYFPHHPYVFDKRCKVRRVSDWQSLPSVPGNDTAELYWLRYSMLLEQALCASGDITTLLTKIDQNPDLSDAVIIVHGDHGSRISPDRAESKSKLAYTDYARQRDHRGTFLAVRFGKGKPGAVVNDDVRIDAVFETLAANQFTSLDPSKVRRYADSPYAGSATKN